MRRISKWQAINRFGETIYTIPFRKFHDAKNFAKLIAKNHKRFSLIGCHQRPPVLDCDMPWEVAYRIRKDYPWKGGAVPCCTVLHHLPEFTRYLTLKHLSLSTITRKKRDITQLESHLFPLKLHHIEPAHLEAALLSLKQARNLTPVTLNRKSTSLKTFFTFLHERGHLKKNPAASLPSAN